MEIPNKSMQLIGKVMYSDLVDFMASFLYANTESDDPKDLYHDFTWFLKYIVKYDGTEHDGDCTQKCFTCSQCLIDSYRDKAETILNKQAFEQYIIDEEITDEEYKPRLV